MSWLKIFSAVLAANLATIIIGSILSFYLTMAFLNLSFSQIQDMVLGGHVTMNGAATEIAEEQKEDLAVIKERQEKRLRELRKQARDARLEREREANARRINQETCSFWRKEYRESPNPKNKAYMESACSRL